MQGDLSKTYALCGVFGGIAVGGAFVLGSGLVAVTGIPLMPAVVNGLWVGIVLATGSYLLGQNRFAGTAMMFVYGVAATFTVLLGPPGWHKIPVAIAMGLAWDVVIWGRSSVVFYILASVAFMAVGFTLLMVAFYLQRSPAYDKMLAALPVVLSISIVTMCIGSAIGRRIVGERLSRLPAFRRVVAH